MKHFPILLAVGSTAVLAACQPSPCNQALPSTQVAGSVQLLDCWAELSPTSVAQMPSTGSATYQGYALGIIDEGGANEDGLIANAALTANFGGNSISGTLSNFSSDSHGDLNGTLTMAGGTIAGPAYTGASISGTLTDTATSDTLSVTATSTGAFFGSSADLILGDISGTATWSNIGSGQTLDGFIVVQD